MTKKTSLKLKKYPRTYQCRECYYLVTTKLESPVCPRCGGESFKIYREPDLHDMK